ncbi:helix-turn-helix domain-containing protein [Sphaerotilus uruguayifluvii]|uniref:Uncharacterized protein n=1 Tax=Sphaerotilus uruguayifluvii TaxID=2735897 RepID=A0ABX2FWN8_9BURK|nr:helix-turn-helix transcriptional regulator [Leptothrix sp. C29]NRT54438.1 hypothetical protein [Leptothrix sp. C29]
MMFTGPDLATLRYRNALALFDEYVRATVSAPDAAALLGLERRFAERLGIQPSYWSQIKSRSRQIGDRLARQFEQACGKPSGWLDQTRSLAATATPEPAPTPQGPRDADERFIVDLVLDYYRRQPQRARQRLLDLIGQPLPAAVPAPAPAPVPATPAREAEDSALWTQFSGRVAPLRPRR